MDLFVVAHEYQRKVEDREKITHEDLDNMFTVVCNTKKMDHRITYSQMKGIYLKQKLEE